MENSFIFVAHGAIFTKGVINLGKEKFLSIYTFHIELDRLIMETKTGV